MKTTRGSPVVLHVEFDGDFLKVMLSKFGVVAWNRWVAAILGSIPLFWNKEEPPARLWFDAEAADFTGGNLDGIDLGQVGCEGAKFDGASAVGAMFGDCPRAIFRNADLRDAMFTGDITAADFRGARLDGVSLVDATHDHNDPPVGLPAELLGTCRAESLDDEPASWPPKGVGLVTHPVPVKASLTESSTL